MLVLRFLMWAMISTFYRRTCAGADQLLGRQLISDDLCQVACETSQHASAKPALRAKLQMKECLGQTRTQTCCTCLEGGFIFSNSGTANNAVDNGGLSDESVELQVVQAKLRVAENEIARLTKRSEPVSPLEVDDIDVASLVVPCKAAEPKQVNSLPLC